MISLSLSRSLPFSVISLCVSLFLSLSLSVYLSIYLQHLSIYPSIHPSLSLSLSLSLALSPFLWLSLCLSAFFVYPSCHPQKKRSCFGDCGSEGTRTGASHNGQWQNEMSKSLGFGLEGSVSRLHRWHLNDVEAEASTVQEGRKLAFFGPCACECPVDLPNL